jgi:hypothetical protein
MKTSSLAAHRHLLLNRRMDLKLTDIIARVERDRMDAQEFDSELTHDQGGEKTGVPLYCPRFSDRAARQDCRRFAGYAVFRFATSQRQGEAASGSSPFAKALGLEAGSKMKLLRDPLGRPIPRLYFDIDELNRECEQIVTNFMERHSSGFSLPVPTDDIIRMIEMEADDLDMYADLPEELDGYTDFFFERKPRVRIAKRLSDPRYENRLRMTLSHEFGHVRFHAPLWRDGRVERNRRPTEPCWTCNRDTIVTAPENDWMEWQAAYIGGALLMPRGPIRLLMREMAVRGATESAVGADSDLAQAAILRVTRQCRVSQQAARVRLVKLGLLGPS